MTGVSADREPIWAPDPDEITAAHVSRFARWLTAHGRARLTGDYLELWRWSTERLEEFWSALWDYFGVRSATGYERVLSGSVMPDVEWFPGAQVSYVEYLFLARISAPVLRPLVRRIRSGAGVRPTRGRWCRRAGRLRGGRVSRRAG